MPQKLALKFIALKAFAVCWTSVKNYALAMNHNGVKLLIVSQREYLANVC